MVVKYYINLIIRYLKANKLTSIFWGYIFVSIVLKAVSSIDITISCPIHSFFHINCLGCGITTATIAMLRFDFVGAWHANPLAFIIVPILLFFFVSHWLQFVKQDRNENHRQ